MRNDADLHSQAFGEAVLAKGKQHRQQWCACAAEQGEHTHVHLPCIAARLPMLSVRHVAMSRMPTLSGMTSGLNRVMPSCPIHRPGGPLPASCPV